MEVVMGKLGYALLTLMNYVLIYFFAYMADTHGGSWFGCLLSRKDIADHPFMAIGVAAVLTWWGCGLYNLFKKRD